ncbi:hypothetical protein [Actinopolyspora erythraea]|uniref:hypothetical protein n=1 Tax=Actinopolyspora erythraea TaxID=414996 RepID=UPI001185F0C7|nr:hypothetical protein [Actinopolyspora erythraea]
MGAYHGLTSDNIQDRFINGEGARIPALVLASNECIEIIRAGRPSIVVFGNGETVKNGEVGWVDLE